MTEAVESRLVQDQAIDHYNGNVIKYPQEAARLKFDFLFRKRDDGAWRYISSFDEASPILKNMKRAVLQEGGEYRIIAARFGYIIEQKSA